MVLWTSSILWFTRRSCALRESVESEESISRFGKLWTDALGVGVRRLAASPKRAWLDSGENRAGHQRTGSPEAALFVAVLFLSGAGKLPEAVSSAVG
ncbi:hypothetical protein B296_00031975 [Ensete ventricosum]|uniref:Uncharacterized protein n=1 Tax=Ensete ventricosum TaxID=4639 RepID=A0A427A1N5_ENSVE|nr:hypothetical protein B296_00031975 [Ensete ventricosum]